MQKVLIPLLPIPLQKKSDLFISESYIHIQLVKLGRLLTFKLKNEVSANIHLAVPSNTQYITKSKLQYYNVLRTTQKVLIYAVKKY